jgi:hypothetical protein
MPPPEVLRGIFITLIAAPAIPTRMKAMQIWEFCAY